ncbi:phosphoglycolate phosphatase-like HAD superfamily hydrolase [Halanaerobium saccharolyticum]|uniref:Phosphoglycolate phosphatase-like HAD superfamily hydrolase n=1 Tax=Halanaerobium saccharolyticum TaxID=43595 RepID=A0A4R6M0B1_9FIRM|nr:HAD hydrolase-like protein [Halanaerobium saccharolyticum]TDO93945.1 phosphoglycolate phosphatase-like HAD superfamily hydrolase [Halanaerobium saccharolyticum]
MTTIANFVKEKEFLICIDSDGSAIDTMTEKHKKAFGPQAVNVWKLEEIKADFLQKWDKVNLYSHTRGINRFQGLIKTFNELKAEGYELPEIDQIEKWTEESSELSNPALSREIENNENNQQLKLALNWSRQVNQEISKLEKDSTKVFAGVKKILAEISTKADLAVVSSANQEALLDEWESYDLKQYVKVILGQEAGTKADNIKDLKAKGYENNKILMIGDAPGDLRAAQKNNVLFYPIIPCEEAESWLKFAKKAAAKFFSGDYQGNYEENLIKKFNFILK